jgi:hypothetical protein
MGCGADKGQKEVVVVDTDITFVHIGVHHMDAFFHRVLKLLETFKELLEPLKAAKHRFLEVTKFWDTPGAKTVHAV